MIHFIGRVALAVKADVTAFHAFRVNQFALIGLDIGQVSAGTQAEFVGGVGIENELRGQRQRFPVARSRWRTGPF